MNTLKRTERVIQSALGAEKQSGSISRFDAAWGQHLKKRIAYWLTVGPFLFFLFAIIPIIILLSIETDFGFALAMMLWGGLGMITAVIGIAESIMYYRGKSVRAFLERIVYWVFAAFLVLMSPYIWGFMLIPASGGDLIAETNGGVPLIAAFTVVFVFILAVVIPYSTAYASRNYLKWKYSQIIADGKRFNFDVRFADILLKHLVWFLLGVVTLGIHTAVFLPVRRRQFIAKNLFFEGEGKADSCFNGTVFEFLLLRIVSLPLRMILRGEIAESVLQNYIWRNTVVSGQRLKFCGSWNSILAARVYWLALTIITGGWWLLLAHRTAKARFIVENIKIDARGNN